MDPKSAVGKLLAKNRISVFSEHHIDATHAPRHARRVKPTVEHSRSNRSVAGNAEARWVLWSRPPRPPRVRYQPTAGVSFAAPAHERRLPRVGEAREQPRAAPAPSLSFPVFRAGRIATRAAPSTANAAAAQAGGPIETSRPPVDRRGSRALDARAKHRSHGPADLWRRAQARDPPQQINWRRRLRRAAVCAGAGLMVSRALVNQGGTVVNESNAAAALHIREDELDDRMTEDCNE